MDMMEDLQAQVISLEEENAYLRERLELAEDVTAHQRSFLQQVIDLIPALIGVKDRDGRFTLANKKIADGFGVTVEDLIGKSDADFSPDPEEVAYFIQKDREAMERNEIIFIPEETVTMANGEIRYFETTKIPVANDEGINDQVLLVALDITERKTAADAREKLLAEAERYSLLVNMSSQALGMIRPDSSVVMANPAMFSLVGADPDEVRQDMFQSDESPSLFDFYPEYLQTKLRHEIFPTVIERDSWHGEMAIKCVDGSIMATMENYSLIRDEDGQPKYIIHAVTDLTDQKKQEQERLQLQAEVIDAQRRSLEELSSPIIPILDGIIVMPLIGSIDTHRAREITRALLAGINDYRAKIVILDITGVPLVDSGVADHLNKTVMAARLKGARTIVTGISDAVAETIVDLGIDWSQIDTLNTLQIGLLTAMKQMGMSLHIQQ